MYELTAADFADTGQWRLILKIRKEGMEAYLENTLHEDIAPQSLCEVRWNVKESEVNKSLEEAVYNCPRLLDDFATRIILYTPRTLFIPREIAEQTAGAEEELFNKVYRAESSDIMTESDCDITAVWSAEPGVKSFLLRTFPGARITCNLMEKLRSCRALVQEEEKSEPLVSEGEEKQRVRLFKDIRDGEVDLLLLQGEELLSASTHEWETEEDIEKLILALKEAYNIGFQQ